MAEHILPKRTYYLIYAVLILCTYLTVQIAAFNLGPLNTVAALLIAFVKATLVILFFMHVKYSSRLTWVVVIGAFFWLAIMLALTMTDYLSRFGPNSGRLGTRIARAHVSRPSDARARAGVRDRAPSGW